MKYNLLIILGTDREGRQSEKAFKLITRIAKTHREFDVHEFDVADAAIDKVGQKDPNYSELTAKADAFIVVSPEYNHSFPGSLKIVLDSEFDNYRHKPVTIAGVSSGGFGGVRAIENLVAPLRKMSLNVSAFDISVSNINDSIDDDGQTDNQQLLEQIDKSLNELAWLAATLKHGRDNISTDPDQRLISE